MWHIAVFDADPLSAQRLAARIGALFTQVNSALSCVAEAFSDISTFLAQADGYDLILVTNPRLHAPAIRRAARGAELAFVLDGRGSLEDLLWLRPLGCLLPSDDDEQILSLLRNFLYYRDMDAVFFTVESRQQLLRIRHADILYFESKAKIVYPRLIAGTTAGFPARLDVVESRLAAYGYIRCHKSYLVNLRHVLSLDKKNRQLLLAGDIPIPVSKQNYAHVLSALSQTTKASPT